mgnify:CR=1 FL=1
MSEVENEIEAIDPEVGEIATVGHPEIDSPNPIADLIDKIGEKDYTSAEKSFQDVMQDRVQDVLDQAKIRLAGQLYNKDVAIGDEVDVETITQDDLDQPNES